MGENITFLAEVKMDFQQTYIGGTNLTGYYYQSLQT